MFWIICLLTTLCTTKNTATQSENIIKGNNKPAIVYLCGLTDSLESEREKKHEKILASVCENLNLKLVIIEPKDRNKNMGNKLYWPRGSETEVLKTYEYIESKLKDENIKAFIGFSNGGSFLNQLIQFKKITAPIISVGSEGPLNKSAKLDPELKIVLMAGKNDKDYLSLTKSFQQDISTKTKNSQFIEFEGDHCLPSTSLIEEVIKSIKN